MSREVWVNKEDNNHPIFWDFEKNGVLYGKRNKVHTIQIAVKVPKLHADLRLEATNLDGKNQIIEGESHSWTRNFYNWLSSSMGKNIVDATNFQDGNINVKDTSGTVRSNSSYGLVPLTTNTYSSDANYFALPTVSTSGIVVGTGTAAESENDYVLATPVAHGISANKLYYQTSQTNILSYIWTSGTRTQLKKLTRFFDNFSGSSITLKEIGQIAKFNVSVSEYDVLVARDLIPDLVIANITTAMISYIYSLVFPSTGSPLRNFYNYLFSLCSNSIAVESTFQDGSINLKDTGGTVRYGYNIGWQRTGSLESTTAYGFFRSSGSTVSGVQVGTGGTAVSFGDYVLESLIAHGTGAGQLSYGITETPSRVWVDPTMTIQQARVITNTSGGSITVKEVGLVGTIGVFSAYNVLMLRDVITDVAVANGESIRPVHQFQVIYP